MLTAVREAFENASNMQPAGEARVGELETTVLTSICAELTGGDARETAIQLFIRKFKEEDGSWKTEECYYSVNGCCFNVILRTDESREVVLNAQCGPTESGYWTSLECEEDEEIEPALRKAFQLMEDNLLCPGCKEHLALGKDFGICFGCAGHWYTVPCSKCGGHFGYLRNNGKHSHCQ
jgi:hypothetical protein